MKKQKIKSKYSRTFIKTFWWREKDSRMGFTLIEMMVAVALFTVVMLVSTGALLSLATANRKAQALQSVMNNLNITIDSMVRSMRQGISYHCGSGGNQSVPQNCTSGSGDTYFAFEPYCGNPANPNDQHIYRFIAPSDATSGYIERSLNGGGSWLRVTAPEVSILDMSFYAIGTIDTDDTQPKVVIKIKGTAGGVNTRISSTFHIQATAVQRRFDMPVM